MLRKNWVRACCQSENFVKFLLDAFSRCFQLTRWPAIFFNPSMKCSLLNVICLIALGAVHSSFGIILVGGGNLINITDPVTGAPWDDVARVTNVSGTHKTSGSAVHLGGGYMLTANHVNLSQGYVSFNGSTTLQILGGSAVQVTSGTDVIDLKVFKLTSNPGTMGVNLFPEDDIGNEGAFGAATHIGWGVGHSPGDASNPWTWGDSSTSVKRWGVNVFDSAAVISYSGYNYEALVTVLDSDATANEAAATNFDSGSGLFIKDLSDEWYLAGTMATVSIAGSSTFAADGTADKNYSVRIAKYADEITSLLTDPIAVPEPAAFAFLIGLMAVGTVMRRRA